MTLSIAHRGDTRQAVENTIPAFLDAIKAGADWVELDVQVTRDGHAIVLHDDSLARLWNFNRLVNSLDWQDIADCFQHKIPKLQTVLECVSSPVMVDFKSEAVVPSLISTIEKCHAWERCLIVTGNVMALRLLQQLAPSSCRGLTWDFSSWPDHDLLRSLGLCYFNPHWTLLSEKLVMTMHDQGYLVSAWTVDDSSAMKKLIDWHVDALVTNDIGRLRTAISVFASNGDGR